MQRKLKVLLSAAIAVVMFLPVVAPVTSATTHVGAAIEGISTGTFLGLETQSVTPTWYPSEGDAFPPAQLSMAGPVSSTPINLCVQDKIPFEVDSFTPSTNFGLPSLKVTFTLTTICGTTPYSASWTFGDGSTATQSAANSTSGAPDFAAVFTYAHTYASIGAFKASVFAIDGSKAGVSAATSIYASFVPSLFYTFYDEAGLISQGITGSKYAIGIVDGCIAGVSGSTYQAELNTFDSKFGLPSTTVNTFLYPGSSCTTTYGLSPETALDIEWAHVAAPGATIYLCLATAALPGGWEDCVQDFVNDYTSTNTMNTAIVSNSWALCAAGVAAGCINGQDPDQAIWSKGAAAGMNLLAGSGDRMSNPCITANYGASNPYAIAVGGTNVTGVGSSGSYGSEKVWADWGASEAVCDGANGKPIDAQGGETYGTNSYYPASTYVPWQVPVLGNSNRYFPDVSMVGDPDTGVPIYDTLGAGWSIAGGTSVGTPIWAGILDVLFSAGAPGLSGFAASFLYAHPSCFNEITVGSARDGLGTPNVGCLATA